MYLENGLFVEKRIRHVHEQTLHLGVASSVGNIREEWWIPRLRSLVKKMINGCHTCKVFSSKAYGKTDTSPLPQFRTKASKFMRRVSILPGRLLIRSKGTNKAKHPFSSSPVQLRELFVSIAKLRSRRLPKNSVIS